jgi:2-polyprenyl-6-methoxyphenol hydroxylase-like FAD-dependent oxidoreductase
LKGLYVVAPSPQLTHHSELDLKQVSPSHIYDVVIVGAGPVGLATAIGLRDRGIENVLVIDQTRAFRPVGQVVDILPNGLKALKQLSLKTYEAVKGTHTSPLQNQSIPEAKPTEQQTTPNTNRPSESKWFYRDITGQPIRSVVRDNDYWVQQYGEQRISTSWFELQSKLRECLPSDRVQVNHRCIGLYEEPSSGVIYLECTTNAETTVNPYAHWTEESQGIEVSTNNTADLPNTTTETGTIIIPAHLVVAADGIHSTLRRALYQNSPHATYAQPQYSGFSAIYCRDIFDIPEELKTTLNQVFFQDSPIVTVCGTEVCAEPLVDAAPRIMMFRRSTDGWGYLIHVAVPCDHLQGMDGQALIDEAQQLLENANFPQSIQQYVGLAPVDKIQQRLYYIHQSSTNSPWSRGRVVLVGDAAHGMPPFMAQGVNQGFEDAVTIAQLIVDLDVPTNWNNETLITEAFRQYEQFRRPIVNRVQDAVLAKTILWSEEAWQDYYQTIYGRNQYPQSL